MKHIIIFVIGLFESICSIGSAVALIKITKSIDGTVVYKAKLHRIFEQNAILTLLLLLLFAITLEYLLITPFDTITNMVCAILMTPYYKDEVYYNMVIKCGYTANVDELGIEMQNVENSKTK